MKKIINIIQLCRPFNALLTFMVVFAGGYLFTNGQSLFYISYAALTALFSAAAGNVVNDIFDIEIDKINRPKRPLPTGIIKLPEAKWFYLLLLLFSMIFSTFNGPVSILFVTFISILLFIYSAYLKKIAFAGNIVIALITASAFIYGGIAGGNVEGTLIPAFFAFMVNLIREILKDIEDVEGDKKAGANTIPIKYGIETSKKIITVLAFILMASTFYPFVKSLYKIEYFILIIITVNPLILLFIAKINSKNYDKLRNLSGLLKVAMIFGLVAIWAGI